MLVPTENNHLCKILLGKDMEFLLQIFSSASLTLPHDILKVWNFPPWGQFLIGVSTKKVPNLGVTKMTPFSWS